MLLTTLMEPIQSTGMYPRINSTGKSKLRSPSLLTSDEDDYPTVQIEDQRNDFLTYHRPSLPIVHSGYYKKRSHSLKSTLHQGTDASSKKAVHFADDFGLELSEMKMINTDELPSIPSEAFKHLQINPQHHPYPPQPSEERVKTITYMEPQFENPMYRQGFDDLLSRQKIVLEQANAIDNRIYGTARLVSFSLQKRVKIRLTTDNWISFRDYDATYIPNSYDGTCDRFSFAIDIDRHRICLGNTIQFCLCYESFGGSEYWDNHSQQNYRLDCLSRTIPDYALNETS